MHDDPWELTLTLAYTSGRGEEGGDAFAWFTAEDDTATLSMSFDRFDMLGKPSHVTLLVTAGGKVAARSYASV